MNKCKTIRYKWGSNSLCIKLLKSYIFVYDNIVKCFIYVF